MTMAKWLENMGDTDQNTRGLPVSEVTERRCWGPIITTIDEGHVEEGVTGNCRTCKTRMPCPPLVKAKQDQVKYADELARKERHARALALTEVTKLPGMYDR